MKSYSVDLTKSVHLIPWKLKILRLIWSALVWPVASRLPFRFGSTIRVFFLRLFGSKVGHSCLIQPGVKILIPSNLSLSDYVAIGKFVEIYNFAPVVIESMTVISQYSFICTGTHDYTHPDFPLTSAPIKIGSECWLAASVMVLPGISIGDGAVIGARSLVSKTMPPWMICGGNPCKVIKPRKISFSQDIKI